jgi:tRNA threonylcarbamoyladenosine biosynthesis protein TsaB
MWVLALDSTTRDGSVALVRDDTIVTVHPGTPGLSHAERVPADLREVLAAAGVVLADIDLFAVAAGPGAFTGLRIGLAAVQGLATALDRPAVGIPALAAWAWSLMARDRVEVAGAWLDAARGEVFAAAYAAADASVIPEWPLTEIAPPTAATPAATLAQWRDAIAPGTPVAVVGAAELRSTLDGAGYRATTAELLAGIVGRLAWRAHQAGHSGSGASLAPVYVRRPDAEMERDRRRDGVARR